MVSQIVAKSTPTDNKLRVFAPRQLDSYIYSADDLSTQPPSGNVDIPLVIDTEYLSQAGKWNVTPQSSRLHLTTQCKGIANDFPMILVNPDYAQITGWKAVETIFHPIDYLRACGHTIELERPADPRTLKGLPSCRFVLYAHFALAELLMIMGGDLKKDVKTIIHSRKNTGSKIEFKRHLELYTGANKQGYQSKQPYIELPWKITINGVSYQLVLTFHDTVALHGAAKYKDLCENTGIVLQYKDNFTPEEKSRMLEMMLTRQTDFYDYAMGDLEVYPILVNNARKFSEVYATLGVSEHFKEPTKTIGATVKNLFTAVLMHRLGVDKVYFNREVLPKLMAPMSAGDLRENPKETSALLSKVDGGRCRNNRPTDTVINAPLVDLDISGCYGEGQRVQEFPIGKPEIISFNADSDVNNYWTLKDFLKAYQSELVPGLWVARISFEGVLKHRQDFFNSWFLPNGHGEDLLAKYAQLEANDTEEIEEENLFNEEDGNQKILQNQIFNAVLTHDGLDWILNVCSTRQRKELLEGLRIKTAAIYPKSKRLDSFDELQLAVKNHTGKNEFKRVGRGSKAKTLRIDGECHNWIAYNLGDLIIDALLFNRKQHPKKTPMNTLYKLCVNTLYGDMTSKYFQSANVVVGNNITARARALAWYMEKGLNGFQTITDGCAFELNRVVYPKSSQGFHAGYLVDLFADLQNPNVEIKPLDGADKIEIFWVEEDSKIVPTLHIHRGSTIQIVPSKDAFDWVNNASMRHLQSLFNVDVLQSKSTSIKAVQDEDGEWRKVYTERLGQFEFEAKDFYNVGIFHGTSNYTLLNPNSPNPCKTNVKMRSYETKKPHTSVIHDVENGLVETDRYGDENNPAIDLLSALYENPKCVLRQEPFIKTGIVKPADYVQRIKTYEDMGLEPGDTVNKSGLLREFSLSQFTFKTFEQWKAWDRVYNRLKDKYGQSFEMFFTDNEGCLKYETMIRTVHKFISSQEPGLESSDYNPTVLFDKHYNAGRDLEMNHPNFLARTALAELLKCVGDE